MPFLAKTFWNRNHDSLDNSVLSVTDIVDLNKIEMALGDTFNAKRYIKNESLKTHLSAAFLDILYKAHDVSFDEFMIFYVIAFHNCRSLKNYEQRLAFLLNHLISYTNKVMGTPVEVKDIEATIIFEFKKYSEAFFEDNEIED